MLFRSTDYVWPGVTNGADWYSIAGGRQDYMNFDRQCRELTLEVSNTKLIPASEIENHWDYNKEALIEYLIQGTYGFQGVVKDAVSSNPIKAKITLIESSVVHDDRGSWVETELFSGTELGDYYRPIKAGTYDILFEADCYQSYTLTNQTITDYQTIVLSDVLLTPISTLMSLSNLSASPISVTTATLNWNGVSNATNFDIRYRENGSSTWTTTTSALNSLDLTALTASTTYEFQVRVTCNTVTSAYSTSELFTTTATPPCFGAVFSDFVTGYSESFENGLGDWTNSASDDIEWTVNSGATPSTGTGPTLAFVGTNYIYTEASAAQGDFLVNGFPKKTAELISPCFDLTGFKNAEISFNYHMNGTDFGTANDGNGVIQVDISEDNGENYTNIFTIDPLSDSAWRSTTIPVNSSFNGKVVKLRLTGTTGSSWSSDIAIDNFNMIAEVDASLGIEDEILSEFVLYPNPVKGGEIKLNVPREITDFNVAISNVLGQTVYENKINDNYNTAHTINTSNLKQGIYFVTVSTNLGMATKKMVIQ